MSIVFYTEKSTLVFFLKPYIPTAYLLLHFHSKKKKKGVKERNKLESEAALKAIRLTPVSCPL